MNWFKNLVVAQTNPPKNKLYFGAHDANNRPIVWIAGDTKAIYKSLGKTGLGFTWYGKRAIWWMYEDRFKANAKQFLETLSQLGVDVAAATADRNDSSSSPVEPIANPSSPEATPAPSAMPNPVQSDSAAAPTERPVGTSRVKSDQTTGEKLMGTFPANPSIYATDVQVTVDGTPVTLHVVFGRKRGDKYLKTVPTYTVSILLNGNEVYDKRFIPPNGGKWTARGPSYDENALLQSYIDKVPELASDPKWKVYHAIKRAMEYDKNDSGFIAILDKIKDAESYKEYPELFPRRTFHLGEQGYEGDYPISVIPSVYEPIGTNRKKVSFRLETAIDHKLAPRPETLAYLEMPVTVHSVQEANAMIDQAIEKDRSGIEEDYVKYLKSFAYTPQQQETSAGQMKPIIDMIMSGSVDVKKIKQELLTRGFVRANKRGGQSAPGMAPSNSFKLIIDDQAIRSATFSRDQFKSNSPDYFFVAIAYNLMRIKHNNIGFMPILLDDAYRSVARIIHRYYSKDIQASQVAAYIDNAARMLWTDLTNRAYKSWDEVYNDFYSGSWGTNGEGQPGAQPAGNNPAVSSFANFAGNLNLGVTMQQAMNDPAGTYRTLSKALHPDMTQMADKEQAKSLFTELSIRYGRIPREVKDAPRTASNWYARMKQSMFSAPGHIQAPFYMAVYRVMHNQGTADDWEELDRHPRPQALAWIREVLTANHTPNVDAEMNWWGTQLAVHDN
jgi:hypothetical protein